MNKWISFDQRLPTRKDANAKGEVELCESNGSRRIGMWDWITPNRDDAVDLWHINGFAAWRKTL